jgi:molybdopterin synthase catalytic subunit
MTFRMLATPIDPAALRVPLDYCGAGGCAIFEGRVRSRSGGRSVRFLEYEAHGALAEAEGARIFAEAAGKFAILAAAGAHRTGTLSPGDLAVWIGVAAEHRGAAFDACRYIIDELKRRLPIWKKEHFLDGAAAWVDGA